MTELKAGVPPRHFVQIACSGDRFATYLYALDATGRVWQYVYATENTPAKWMQMTDRREEIPAP